MYQDRTISPARRTRAAMDRVIDEHFAFEGRDDVDGVLRTLATDVDHDVIGSPTGPLRGKDQARGFYEHLFADLDQQDVTSTHRYYGDDFVVDESVWRGTAVGNPLGFPVVSFYSDFDRGALAHFDAVDRAFEATVFGTTVLDWPGFVAFGQSFLDAFSDGRHEFDFVVAEGDTVATIGRYRGCHDGELMGVPATGNQVDFTVMHVDRVQDGRIVEHRGIGDINAMWAQLGVEPATAG